MKIWHRASSGVENQQVNEANEAKATTTTKARLTERVDEVDQSARLVLVLEQEYRNLVDEDGREGRRD